MPTQGKKPRNIHFAIRLSEAESDFIDEMAAKNKVSRTDYIRIMLTAAMIKNGYYTD